MHVHKNRFSASDKAPTDRLTFGDSNNGNQIGNTVTFIYLTTKKLLIMSGALFSGTTFPGTAALCHDKK